MTLFAECPKTGHLDWTTWRGARQDAGMFVLTETPRKLWFTTAVVFLLNLLLWTAGCTTATLQSEANDAAAKRFVANGGKARLYVYRLPALAGAIYVEPVFVDGRMLGQNGPSTFLVADVPPGHHTVATAASSVAINAAANTAYFVKQRMSSWGPHCFVERVAEDEGKEEVAKCERAAELY